MTISVINLHGRVFLPPHEDPFAMAEDLLAEARKTSPLVFVDFHAEATSEKIALGWHFYHTNRHDSNMYVWNIEDVTHCCCRFAFAQKTSADTEYL